MYQKDESQCLMEVQVVSFTREGALARERPGSAGKGKGKGTRPISEGAEATARRGGLGASRAEEPLRNFHVR